MPLLPDNYPGWLESILGSTRVTESIRRQQNTSRNFLTEAAAGLRVAGTAADITLSDDDPVVDLGGRNANEQNVATPMVNFAKTPAARAAEDAVGYRLTDDNCGAGFVAHRFVDVGATRYARAPICTTCPGAVVASQRPTQDGFDVCLIDQTGVRILKPVNLSLNQLRQRINRRTPLRDDLWDAHLDSVAAIDGGRLRRIPVRRTVRADLPFRVSDGLLASSQFDRLTLARRRTGEDVGTADATATNVRVGPRILVAAISDLGIEREIPGDEAPIGFIWGNPNNPIACSRNSQDDCKDCCDVMTGAYIGAVITIGIAAAQTANPYGFAAGLALAAVVGIVGIVHVSSCRDGCNTLYDKDTGVGFQRTRMNLTAAVYDDDGRQIAYDVEIPSKNVTARFSRDQILQFVWSRADVRAVVNGSEQSVGHARRPNGEGFYLRTYRDKFETNNLTALPAAMP